MITAIIPTLCKVDNNIFNYLLKELERSTVVSEIIIIDNTCGEFVKEYSLTPKIKVLDSDNLYVNMAWNKGVELCNTDNYVLLNDDILVHSHLFNVGDNYLLLNSDIGIVTYRTVESMQVTTYINEIPDISDMQIHTYDLKNIDRQGWFILGRKSQWKPIPEELTLFFGDDLIYKRHIQLGRRNVMVTGNIFISHFTSTTTNTFNQCGKQVDERVFYRDALNKGWTCN